MFTKVKFEDYMELVKAECKGRVEVMSFDSRQNSSIVVTPKKIFKSTVYRNLKGKMIVFSTENFERGSYGFWIA